MFPSHWEVLVIFLVVLLLFGARRIPEMAQGLGKGIREFRKAVKDVQEEVDVTGTLNNTTQTIPPPAGQVARQEPSQAAPAQAQAAPAQPVASPPAAEATTPTETDNSSGARS